MEIILTKKIIVQNAKLIKKNVNNANQATQKNVINAYLNSYQMKIPQLV